MLAMSALDSQIDELYRLPLGEFTAARNRLARTLEGEDARGVKALAKPTVVPWAINQLYWKARPLYARLLERGAALRAAQLAALKGREADVRRASDAHRTALAAAIEKATRLAEEQGSRPAAGELARTLEALSLAPTPPEQPGRLTEPLQPAGFEALTGVGPIAPAKTPPPAKPKPDDTARLAEAARKRGAEAERRREAAVKVAQRAVDEARVAEATARRNFDRAQRDLQAAEQALAAVRRSTEP